jgi:hypothetical protein
VNALRRIHAALAPGGLLVDTQPVSPHPRMHEGDTALGSLDMRAWAATIDEIDGQTALAVDEGLYRLERVRSFIVNDRYDNGPDLISYVQDWQGTQIPATVARRLSDVSTPVSLHQEIRLRLYRRLQPT